MKLYDMTGPPTHARCGCFSPKKASTFKKVSIDVIAGENLTEEYMAMNPRGGVPTLQLDDGTTIDEARAICRYFSRLLIQGRPSTQKTPGRKTEVASDMT